MPEIAMTKETLDAGQGKQMMEPQPTPTPIDRLASEQAAPESPLPVIMATLLNPNAANLGKLSTLFESYVEVVPAPDYVKETAKAFVASLKRWSLEKEKVMEVPVNG